MNGKRRLRTNAEYRLKGVGSRPEMGNRAQKLQRRFLLLKRKIGRGDSFNLDVFRFQLERLLCFRRQDERAAGDDGGADVLLCDLRVICELFRLQYDLKFGERAAVSELDKAERIAGTHGFDPAGDRDRFSVKGFRRCVQLLYRCPFHGFKSLSFKIYGQKTDIYHYYSASKIKIQEIYIKIEGRTPSIPFFHLFDTASAYIIIVKFH